MSSSSIPKLQAEIAALQARITQLENALASDEQPESSACRHLMINSEHVLITKVDTQGLYTYTNPAFVRKFSADQPLPGQLSLQAVVEEDREKLQQTAEQCLAHPGKPLRILLRKRRAADAVYWTDWEMTGLAGADGVGTEVLYIGFDISEHFITYQALRDSEARFRAIFDGAGIGMALVGARGRPIATNSAMQQMLGYSNAELCSMSFAAYTHRDDVDNDRQLWQEVLHGQRAAYQIEKRYTRRDGTQLWGKLTVSLVQSAGEPVYGVGMVEDISAQKQAVEDIRRLNDSLEQRVQERTQELTRTLAELEKQRDFAHQVTETMREGVIVYEAGGIIEYANPFLCEMVAAPLEEIVGRPFEAYVAKEDQVLVQEQLQTRRAGRSTTYEIRLRLRDGGERYVQVTGTPQQQDGHYAGGVAVISDLTQRRQAEEQLRCASAKMAESNRELARSVRMKDEFLANVSHELRTPLTGILALTESLLAGTYGEIQQQQQRPLTLVEESGHHLLSLINDVLDMAKSEAGKLEIVIEPVAAEEVCQASLRLVRYSALQKRQHIVYTLEPAGLVLNADARRLKQILVNLLSNAVKFTPEGGHVGLQVSGDSEQKQVTFTVWDDGIGIPAEFQQRIFEPFVQVESNFNRAYPGTGLGLALVQRLTTLQQGSVTIESRPQQGSRFHVLLPWHADGSPAATELAGRSTADADPVPDGLAAEKGRTAPAAPAATILLAEDNDVTSSAMQDYLTLLGFAVVTATDGLETIRQVEAQRPDLLLLDIQMPRMGGVQVLNHLRALPDPALARVPVIVLSAHAMPGARELFLAAGADDYLSKPLHLADLRKCIKQYLPQMPV